jgi:hypothetical protein
MCRSITPNGFIFPVPLPRPIPAPEPKPCPVPVPLPPPEPLPPRPPEIEPLERFGNAEMSEESGSGRVKLPTASLAATRGAVLLIALRCLVFTLLLAPGSPPPPLEGMKSTGGFLGAGMTWMIKIKPTARMMPWMIREIESEPPPSLRQNDGFGRSFG